MGTRPPTTLSEIGPEVLALDRPLDRNPLAPFTIADDLGDQLVRRIAIGAQPDTGEILFDGKRVLTIA